MLLYKLMKMRFLVRRFEPSWARVMSGSEEGVYGWIALNYLHGGLANMTHSRQRQSTVTSAPPPPPDAWPATPLGALDLGGASLEVTFPLGAASAAAQGLTEQAAQGEPLHTSHPHKGLTIADTRHQLHSHTFQHFGLNEAYDRSVKLLLSRQQPQPTAAVATEQTAEGNVIENNSEGLTHSNSSSNSSSVGLSSGAGQQQAGAEEPAVYHPCLFEGYESEYVPLLRDNDTSTPLAVRLIGRPDWQLCSALGQQLVAVKDTCRRPPCVLGVPLPPLDGRFVALTGFSVIWSYLKVPLQGGLSDVTAAAQDYCSQSADAAKQRYGDQINYERYCFWVPYAAALIRDGLQLSESQVRVGSKDVGWPLGAAILEGLRMVGMADSSGDFDIEGDPDDLNALHVEVAKAPAESPSPRGWRWAAQGNLVLAPIALASEFWWFKVLFVISLAGLFYFIAIIMDWQVRFRRLTGGRGAMQHNRPAGLAAKKSSSISNFKNIL